MNDDRTIVMLHAPARDLGKILAALEHDAAIDVLRWTQNVPRVSADVQIALRSRAFPRAWHGADVALHAESHRGVMRFVWHVIMAGDVAGERITRTKSMGRSIEA